MRFNRFFPAVCCLVMLFIALTAASFIRQKPEAKAETVFANEDTEEDRPEPNEEMRGLWVTYFELDMTGETDMSETGFRNKFENIASKAEKLKFNTIIAQVRPFCDALYESEYFPCSHILSGEQGADPGYDALKIMCEICRKHGLKIHAWLNPYRVTLNETPEELSNDNPYYRDDIACIETDNWIILDPSDEKSRELIINGISELVNKYDIDGVQFDDYFYPADTGDNDSEQYQSYLDNTESQNPMDLEAWRKYNVNLLVAEAYRTVHDKGKVFGISPQGNLKNNEGLAADVVNWCCANGFVDYICPQIYFSPTNPKLGFEDSLKEWTELDFAKGVRLYVGLAGYKANDKDADEGTWAGSNDILSKEYQTVKNDPKVSGIMLYSFSSLIDDQKSGEINNLVRSFG